MIWEFLTNLTDEQREVENIFKNFRVFKVFALSEKPSLGARAGWCCQPGGQEGSAPLVRGRLPPGHQNYPLGDPRRDSESPVALSRPVLGYSPLAWGTQGPFEELTQA